MDVRGETERRQEQEKDMSKTKAMKPVRLQLDDDIIQK